MRRTLFLSLLVLAAAVAVGFGSYSAFAGTGPASSVAGAVIGSDGPDDASDADEQDVDGEEDAVQSVDGDADGEGAEHIAQVIADAFDDGSVTAEDVMALHEQGIGFGAIFKLYALAEAMDMSVEDLLATLPTNGDGEFAFGFGKLFKSLTDEQRAVLESGPKNLGELVSASHKPDGAGSGADEVAATGLQKAQEKFASHPSNGNGPPEGVPAHGRP